MALHFAFKKSRSKKDLEELEKATESGLKMKKNMSMKDIHKVDNIMPLLDPNLEQDERFE